MKRKRKPKQINNYSLATIISEMMWHGFTRGMAFGAIYGALLILTVERNGNDHVIVALLPLAIILGLPFGAGFGGIAGLGLGLLNGLLIGILMHLAHFSVKDWSLYRSSLAAVCGALTLAAGIIVSHVFASSSASDGFFVFAVVPSLIAAIVFGHASQRAEQWYLAALDRME